MQSKTRYIVFISITAFAVLATCLISPIKQNPSYHFFADQRIILSIANFFNVITNLPFLFIGIYWLISSRSSQNEIIYAVISIGILLTGFGSAYYHLHPNNNTLIFDRLPMTIVFTSFLSLAIAEHISISTGRQLLIPFILTGIASVLWWNYSGDLRFYGFVQFYPILAIPLIYLLFGASKEEFILLLQIVGWYLLAKLFEHFDKEIFSFTQFISGHSLKHLAAAMASFYIIQGHKEH